MAEVEVEVTERSALWQANEHMWCVAIPGRMAGSFDSRTRAFQWMLDNAMDKG